jgi:long-chain acyl-CoA synthetase
MTRDSAAERREIDAAVAGQTVCTMFQERIAAHGEHVALKWKDDGAWQELTWQDYGSRVARCAAGLVSIGLQPGEFVNILAPNCADYYVTDLGVLHAGGTPVSLYNTLAPEQVEYIINHCEARYLVLGDASFYEQRIRPIRDRIPGVRRIVLFEGAETIGDDARVCAWTDLLAAGEAAGEAGAAEVGRRWRGVQPEDLATLIYTSGTTGPPKGVMITHRNVAWTAESLETVSPRYPGMRHISYLPLAHIAERMVGHYLQIRGASTCFFCPAPQQIAEYVAEVRPQYFFAVPRIWEKMHAGLQKALAAIADEGQRAMIQGALDVSLERLRLEQAGREVPAELAARAEQAAAVTALVRQRVGLDQVEIASTGAAPISTGILEFFHAIGVPILEVYGQSEGSGPTSWNRPGAARIGTVGPAIPGVDVRLAEDGELLVRGGNITRGYYKEPTLTAETFDPEGWLSSGDVAVIDPDGYIRIVDRKKEIIITAGGKNIAPSNLENLLKQEALVGQACVIGDKRAFVSALIVLDAEATLPWSRDLGLGDDLAAIARDPRLLARIQAGVDSANLHLNNAEQVKKFVVLPNEWTVDSGELTPTLKMKRKVVYERYADLIESMYATPRT